MRGAEAAAGLAMKILVEQHVIAEMRVLLQYRHVAEDRPAAVGPTQENPAQAPRQLSRDLAEMRQRPGSHRAFDLEIVAVIGMKPLQRLDDQEVDRHPDWSAPIRVAAEHARIRVSRDVADAEPVAGALKCVGI